MNRASASDYVRNLRQMLRGEAFHRTLKIPAIDFYLSNIKLDFGDSAYRNALQSLEAHLNYYASLSTGHEQPSLRKLLAQHKAEVRHAAVESIEADLEAAVRRSMDGPADERKSRLGLAPKKPTKLVGSTVIYKRNPDVIAEVLIRANGSCEACGKKAPFLKRSDGSPYLEVHHKVRLADNGDDAVENAIAVCPNCHRRAHYG
jgi:5-methylcytosine-specific restriction enzyme A